MNLVYCPVCKPVYNKSKRQINGHIDIYETNWSGCGVDIGTCKTCGKTFQISYKVDTVIHIPTWDRNPEDD